MPWTKALTESPAAAVPAQKVDDRIEELPNDEKTSSKQMKRSVGLLLPKGWGRVMWSIPRVYWGKARAERFTPRITGDVVSAEFAPDVEAGAGTWEVRFPTCGAILALQVTEAEG